MASCAATIIAFFLFSLINMLAWNYLDKTIFNVQQITFLQSMCGTLLLGAARSALSHIRDYGAKADAAIAKSNKGQK